VPKHSASKELLMAIEQVWHGKSYISPELRPEDWVERRTRVEQFAKELTARQCDVVQLFAEGYSMKEMADRLHVSRKTIEFHKHHIMMAYHLKSNSDLVLFAIKKGLISVKPELHHLSHDDLLKHRGNVPQRTSA
jgi:DNA-binding NarL/FixJ family response regulator